MPTRVFTEDSNIKKRKTISRDEKPSKKSTKVIKQEIKKEPIDFSDDDINDDDVMDIEEADKTMSKICPKKRVVKTKKTKKVPKGENNDVKVKPKKKKKPESQQLSITATNQNNENNGRLTPKIPAAVNVGVDNNPKPTKKAQKVKEKKVKEKRTQSSKTQVKKQTKPGETSKPPGSDSESTVEETDTYETCGVTTCQRPSGKYIKLNKDLRQDRSYNFNSV